LLAAFDAWGQRDFPKMIAECLAACGIRMTKPESLQRGWGWIFFKGSSAVFVLLDQAGGLSVESPVVLVPTAQRTPLFRSLLELNQSALGAARFCLRVDRVVLKYSDRIENVSPPKLMAVLSEVAGAADHFDNLLGHRFSAPMLGPEVKKSGAQPWQLLGAPLQLTVAGLEPPAPPAQTNERQNLAEAVGEMSAGSFSRFSDDFGADDGETLELARDPAAGRRNPAAPMLGRLRAAVIGADRLSALDGGLFALLVLRAIAMWGRALLPPETQGMPTFLLAVLGDHVERLPEPGFRPGPTRPAADAVLAAYAEVDRDGSVDPRHDSAGVFPLKPFKAPDEARAHARKFMALMTRCPKDDEVRVLLLEGALCEMLMRSAPLPKEVHERVVRSLLEPAPPSAMRVHDLQNALTRSWP
jgi:hypothetical protein